MSRPEWTTLLHEFHDIAIAAARARQLKTGIEFLNPAAMARAWLLEDEGAWWWQNARHHIAENEMPGGRISRGLSAFDTGICSVDRWRGQAVISLMPPFMSPKQSREHSGIASAMRGYGPLGEQRFTGLHEIGHWLADQAGIYGSASSPGKLLRSEAVADGFAIAWAVAAGGNAQHIIDDTGLFRAGGAVIHFSPAYLTFPIMEEAAEIGAKAAARGNLNPWDILDEVHGAAARRLPPVDFIDSLDGIQSAGDIPGGEGAEINAYIKHYLEKQEPWNREQEKTWWAALCVANPDDAQIFRRAQVTETLSLVCENGLLEAETDPLDAEFIVSRLVPIAALSGREAQKKMEDAIPTETSRAAHAGAYERAAAILNGPYDGILSRCLTRLAEHTASARNEPSASKTAEIQGLKGQTAPFVIVDARNGQIGTEHVTAIAAKLSGANVRAIAAVGDTAEAAERLAKEIRLYSDTLRASIHSFDNDAFRKKLPSIQDARQKGNILAIGGLPELRKTAREHIR